MARVTGSSRQGELFPRSMTPTIPVDSRHPLVLLTDSIDWTSLIESAQVLRRKKLKSKAGRPPHLRALLGVLILMSVRKLTYREAEDLVRYYAPARYLCDLTETTWTPDFTTTHDFAVLLGEEGHRLLNESVVARTRALAVERGLADPQVLVADTTTQQAAIPYPNEVGLLSAFAARVSRAAQKAGSLVRGFASFAKDQAAMMAKAARGYHLFAKTKEARDAGVAALLSAGKRLQQRLGRAMAALKQRGRKVHGKAQRARKQLLALHDVFAKLHPQIQHWLDTGKVARGKIIHLSMPKLYAVVCGKVGKGAHARWSLD